MKKLITILITILILFITLNNCNDITIDKNELTKSIENAYFEGQKDALNNDIRIKLNKDSIYIWIKSPWNDKTNPIFIPTYLNTKN